MMRRIPLDRCSVRRFCGRGVLVTAILGAVLLVGARPAPGQLPPDLLQRFGRVFGFEGDLLESMFPGNGEPTAAQRIDEADAALKRAWEVARFFNPEAPEPAATADALRLVPEQIEFARFYLGLGGARQAARYLAIHLWLVNPADEAVTIHREDMRLVVPGKRLKPGRAPEHHRIVQVPGSDSRKRLSDIPQEGPVEIKAHAAKAIWVVFYDLPGVGNVPEMTLELPAGAQQATVDLNALALGRMKPSIKFVGPKDLLAVVTIGGPMSDVGAGGLVDIFRKLVKRKTTRIVLAWGDEAPAVPHELMRWLSRSLAYRQAGRRFASNPQRPELPDGLVDLRFATIPEGTFYQAHSGLVPAHESVAEAVAASLVEPFRTIPLPALRQAITSGGPWVRPVAIRAGRRLPLSELPLLLKLSHSSEEAIATAAVSALGGFSTAAAIGRLAELVREGTRPLQKAAIQALATSRHGAAHQTLKDLLEAALQGVPTVPLEILAEVLSHYPRALWRDALFKLSLRGAPDDRRASLVALSRVGHPRLVEALAAALESTDQRLRLQALELLIERKDQRSQKIALDYTLASMEDQLPGPTMMRLLQQTKPPEAVPLLLEKLELDTDRTLRYLPLLARIGGRAARERITEIYPRVSPDNQAELLGILEQMDSPRLLELAKAGLTSEDPSLQRRALQVYQDDASPEAVAILVGILKETDEHQVARQMIRALGEIGSPPARLALWQGFRRGGAWAKDCGEQYVKTLRSLSAGYQVYLVADALANQQKWDKALEQFNKAIQLDPHLIRAWSGRAKVNMWLGHGDQARRDFRHVLARDPKDQEAITFLGILKVEGGDVEGGLAFVSSRAESFAESSLFAYNSACLKALAAKHLVKKDPERAAALRNEAVQDLARSIELGLDEREDLASARADPDLKSLHGRKDFEAVLGAAEKRLPAGEEPEAGLPE